MVKHIILWQLKDEYSDAEKADIKAGIKAGLEGLAGQIPGLSEGRPQRRRAVSLPERQQDGLNAFSSDVPHSLAGR